MKNLIIYAHPNKKSFSHAVLEQLCTSYSESNQEYEVRDLYADPIKLTLDREDFESFQRREIPEDILKEQELISWADRLVFVYPVWWWDVPAILKGYIDRIFTYGFAYIYTENGPVPLLEGKSAWVIAMAGTDESVYQAENRKEATFRSLTDGTLEYCGITTDLTVNYGINKLTEERAKSILATIYDRVLKLTTEQVEL